MKTPKEVLDEIIIGMPDEDCMKGFIIKAMEEYAKLYHEELNKKLLENFRSELKVNFDPTIGK